MKDLYRNIDSTTYLKTFFKCSVFWDWFLLGVETFVEKIVKPLSVLENRHSCDQKKEDKIAWADGFV